MQLLLLSDALDWITITMVISPIVDAIYHIGYDLLGCSRVDSMLYIAGG